MKETVLEIVQSALNEISGDNVNSIDDTTESQRVALFLKDIFYELIDQRDWSQHKKMLSLNSSSDSDYPNYLKLPDEVQEMQYLRYNRIKSGETRKRWHTLEYLYPDQFIKMVNDRNSDESNIDVVTDFDGTELLIRNDLAPNYWTSFDDTWVVTDAYDSAVDSILQSSKSQAYAITEPTINLVNEFVVDLPTDAFSLLKVTLKNRCFENIAQRDSTTIALEERRQRNRMSRKNWKARGGVRYPNYGRVPAGTSYTRNPTFKQDRE